jgi:hypothetical protein
VNASTVHSILLYKYALHSQHGEAKPSAGKKQSSVLLDDMGKCQFVSESKESSPDSHFHSNNELS